MAKSVILWGAGLACALGGAAAGNALGSSPVTDRSAIEMFYQSHRTASANQQGQQVLPDHYPLVTRGGVVGVAQLSDRGLFSQARYRTDAAAGHPFGVDDSGPGSGLDAGFEAISPPAPAIAADPDPAEPRSFAYGSSQADGQAKIIDVRATLAMR